MLEIIALQEYTDAYISLYEGEIRNIPQYMANQLIEDGIVALHNTTITLPQITSTDAGKTLSVNENGEWEVKKFETGLPTITATDEGKILTIKNSNWILEKPNIIIFKEKIHVDQDSGEASILTESRSCNLNYAQIKLLLQDTFLIPQCWAKIDVVDLDANSTVTGYRVIPMAVQLQKDGKIYFYFYNSPTNKYVCRSLDSNNTWQDVNINI